MSQETMYVSVVIPLFNEEASIAILNHELQQVLVGLRRTYEIIYVDDGSTDGSFAILAKLHESDPEHIRVIRFRRNFGKTAALAAAFKRACGQRIATMDADLQDDPAELPSLLAKLDEGHDLVAAWREHRQDPLSKRIPSRFANWVVQAITGVRLHDINCGYKVYRQEVVRDLKLYGDLHRYVPVLASWQGYDIAEAPVSHRPRQFGHSKYGWSRFFRGFFDFLAVLFLTRYLRRPLQLFGTLGAISFIIGIVLGLYLTYLRFFGPGIGWRPALFLDLLAIVVGVQLVSIGLLGEMLRNYSYRTEEEYTIRTEL